MRSLARVLLLAGLFSLAAACGGGGENHAPVGAVNGPLVTTTSKTTINLVASASDSALTYQVPLTFGPRAPGVGIYMSSTAVGLVTATIPSNPEANPQVTLVFKAPSTLGAGTYPGQISLFVCAGDGTVSCNMLTGYRLDLTVSLIVTPPPLTPVSQVTLNHDVVDAKYSRALDSIVMISAYPSNALYLYNTRTHAEVSQALRKVPTAVTVGPTGTDAAVGHDGLITYIDLAALTQASPPAPVELAVSAAVFDLALDGYGYVHAIPQSNGWVSIHSVAIATNVETLSTGEVQVWAGSHIKLQPGTHFIYTPGPPHSGSYSVSKWDVTSGTANFLYEPDQPYIAVAGNLWFADDGVTAYTAWGSVVQASPVQAQDLASTGQPLTVSPVNDFNNGSMLPSTQFLVSVDASDATNEILAVDAGFFGCDLTIDLVGCLTGIDIYDSTSLTQTGHYSIPTVTIAGEQYAQRALFVFHSSDGTGRFALSTLLKESSTPAQYYLTDF